MSSLEEWRVLKKNFLLLKPWLGMRRHPSQRLLSNYWILIVMRKKIAKSCICPYFITLLIGFRKAALALGEEAEHKYLRRHISDSQFSPAVKGSVKLHGYQLLAVVFL